MKKINKLGFIRTSKYIGIFLELIITAYDCYDDLYWEDQWQKGEPLVHYLIQIGEIAGSVKNYSTNSRRNSKGPYENVEIRRLYTTKYIE